MGFSPASDGGQGDRRSAAGIPGASSDPDSRAADPALPLVTIGIPTHSRVAYLEEAVRSAMAQTHPCIEILIRDNGTTPAIAALGAELMRQDGRVRYERNPRDLGMAGNWNALADTARGEWLVLLADDDRLLPDFVARLVGSATDADVVFSNHYVIDSDGRRDEAWSRALTAQYRRDLLPPGPLAEPARWVWRNSLPICASLLRTEAVRRLRFQEDLNTPEIELFARLAHAGGRFVFVPEYLAEYRVHAGSATAQGLRSERLVKYLEPLPVPPGVEPDKRAYMEQLLVNAVSRSLRAGEVEAARVFLRSPYYPRRGWTDVRTSAQRLSAALPPPLARRLYSWGGQLKQQLARARSRGGAKERSG